MRSGIRSAESRRLVDVGQGLVAIDGTVRDLLVGRGSDLARQKGEALSGRQHRGDGDQPAAHDVETDDRRDMSERAADAIRGTADQHG